ncbi:hypothetical protein ACN28I_11220 [Archangium gephyra]|uniref:hypothetical protein n=1 Tax=Archangium gephyra TaxID=48 RepID=UPI003B7EB539
MPAVRKVTGTVFTPLSAAVKVKSAGKLRGSVVAHFQLLYAVTTWGAHAASPVIVVTPKNIHFFF